MESLDGVIVQEKGNDVGALVADVAQHINLKVACFLFFLGMFIFSDIFVTMLPADAVDMGSPNLKGTTMQLGLMCLAYIIIDLCVQTKIL